MDRSDEQIDKDLVDTFRTINVDFEWWDCTYEDFSKRMEEKYIRIDDISFSGFYSQGDGASFEGTTTNDMMAKFMEVHYLDKQYPATYFFAKEGEVAAYSRRNSSRYSHEHSVDVRVDDVTGNPYSEEDCVRWEIYDTMQSLYETEVHDFEEEVAEIYRGYMKDLYYQLREEYEYLTSDEAVWESIVANGLHTETI